MLTHLEEHSEGRDPPAALDAVVQRAEARRLVAVDLHLREQPTQPLAVGLASAAPPSGAVPLTSSGYLTPSRLCSEPSEEALQRPQWKVMRPTLNLDARPPPLMW